MNAHRLLFFSLLASGLALLGCGTSGNGTGGSTGAGGSAGTGGGGSGGAAITPGLYSASPRGTLICLFVNQDGTKLVADASCRGGEAFYLLDLGEAMVQDDCLITYPEEGDDPQEIPIEDGRFEIQATRTDGIGEYTIMVSGQFDENGRVSGVGTHSRDCPDDRSWSAAPGCCSQCQRDGWCE
jgi:hypothetical protein